MRKGRETTLVVLDNSSINNIADVLTADGVRAFRRLLLRSRVEAAATSVNLVEISRTPDIDRAQRLLATLVGISGRRALADPESLIVESIEHIVEGKRGRFSDDKRWATGTLRRLWNNLRTGKHNMIYPVEGLEKSIAIYRLFFSICLSGRPDQAGSLLVEGEDLAATLNAAARELARKAKPQRPLHLARLAVAVWFSSGLLPRSDIVERFWRARKLHSTWERFAWLLGSGRAAFETGPLVGLAGALWSQTQVGWDAGHLMDALQLVLLQHVDLFVTDDQRLRRMLGRWAAERRSQVCSTVEWFERCLRPSPSKGR
jgi:hypothetical protein